MRWCRHLKLAASVLPAVGVANKKVWCMSTPDHPRVFEVSASVPQDSCSLPPGKAPGCSPARALAQAIRSGAAAVGFGQGCYGRVCFVRRMGRLIDGHVQGETTHFVRPDLPVTFVADGILGASLAGLGARDMLIRVGLGDLVDGEIAEGTCFKLVLFDDEGDVFRADWAGVRRVVEKYYPQVAEKIEPHWGMLQNSSWNDLGGPGFDEIVKKDGPMLPDRYLAAENTAMNARLFLASTLYLTMYFKGDGYSYDGDVRGSEEYFAPNRAFASLPDEQIIALDI